MKTTEREKMKTLMIAGLCCVVLLLALLLVNTARSLNATQSELTDYQSNVNALSRLESNGYQVIDTQVEIMNPGSLGFEGDSILLTINNNDEIYFKELGDINLEQPCKDTRDRGKTINTMYFSNTKESACSNN